MFPLSVYVSFVVICSGGIYACFMLCTSGCFPSVLACVSFCIDLSFYWYTCRGFNGG